ncbi:phage tail sheath subtilisin-like domain-containing protein [Aeromonas piscicola]|uniref:phage tail sheath subtilisin-like domain-containing protein n=1 Tax=Aeromonas piscicola TaxID=600645 RepID=UPI0005B52825|nr:phage tail sheath subtilisin-like domain-containing protein [Aeromonas piscicola]
MNQIPNTVRMPLTYIEINNRASGKGLATRQDTVLMFGCTTTEAQTGLVVKPMEITSGAAATALYGQGSMLAMMATRFLAINKTARLYCVPIRNGTITTATGVLTLTGKATAAGALSVMIAGQQVEIDVVEKDTPAMLYPMLIAAINAIPAMPVIASVDAKDGVLLTAKWNGSTGCQIDVRMNYYAHQRVPAGLDVDITKMSGSTTDSSLLDAIGAMGNTWFNRVVNPFTNSAALTQMATELLTRWGPLKMIDGIAFQAFRGNYGETSAFGLARNEFLFSTMATGISPTPPWELAAINCAVACSSLSIDPALPLQTLALPGFLPPAEGDRWEWNESNNLLYDGISPFSVDDSGVAHILRQITMYRKDDYGNLDDSYLDVNTIATLSYIRYVTKVRIEGKFGRMKLAEDGARFRPGSSIVTPSIIKTELLALFTELEWAGLVVNFEHYKDELQVEIDENDRNRVNVYASQNIVRQFRIYAQAINYVG